MVLAPVVLNMAFFWVIDNIIMRKRGKASSHGVSRPMVGGEGVSEDDPGSSEGDETRDDKEPLLNECGCCPCTPATRRNLSSGYAPASPPGPPSSNASRCRAPGSAA